MDRRLFLQAGSCAAVGATLQSDLLAGAAAGSPFLGAWLHLHSAYPKANVIAEKQRAIDEVLDGCTTAGLNTIVPFITNSSGAAHFPSRKIKKRLDPDWDPLEYLILGAEKRKLDVYPAFCVLVCGHQDPSGILIERPEWASRHPDGKPMGHICPTRPDVRDWLAETVCDVVKRYSVKGIMLDYLRYYNRPSRLDAESESAFATWRKSRAGLPANVALQHYREEGISLLAKQISDMARAVKPSLRIAIYSWGAHVARNHRVAQPWHEWSRDGLIDQVNVSGYCYPDNYGEQYLTVFRRRIHDAIELNRAIDGKASVTFSLGVSTSHGKIKQSRSVNEYLSIASDEGAQGVSVFTWNYLQPFLADCIQGGYFDRFRKRVSTRTGD